MSQTISVGVVGPSHWAYMASVMAEKLQTISEAKRTTSRQIPAGVYRDALEFYRLVLEAAGDNIPINPPASVNAYALAADALRTVYANDISRTEVEQTLGKQQELLKNLQDDRDLTGEEINTLSSLQQCFLWLKREGESDAYENRVRYAASAACPNQ